MSLNWLADNATVLAVVVLVLLVPAGLRRGKSRLGRKLGLAGGMLTEDVLSIWL